MGVFTPIDGASISFFATYIRITYMVSNISPQVSFCIVNLNARDYLRACLDRLPEAATQITWEVIIVDNGSTDGSVEMIRTEFPWVRLICNETNLGYTRPMNQALHVAQGEFLVQLNPDTLPGEGAFDKLYSFMRANPEVGICGPKVLNRDGTLQRQCRRSAARPWDVVTYFSGLWRLFPHSRLFGRYLLAYLPEDETAEVEAVSGSCMMVRRAVIDQIGYLDEQFFAYQEDSDFCFRARQAGWKVFYYPEAVVVHYGGFGGSRTQPYRGIIEWHRSYLRYYRKHLAKDYCFLVNGLMYLGVGLRLSLSLVKAFFSREKVVGTKKP
jgi:GT2 family glycosyltransferase